MTLQKLHGACLVTSIAAKGCQLQKLCAVHQSMHDGAGRLHGPQRWCPGSAAGREPPPGNPYLALLAAADTLADAETTQASPPPVTMQSAPAAVAAAESDHAAASDTAATDVAAVHMARATSEPHRAPMSGTPAKPSAVGPTEHLSDMPTARGGTVAAAAGSTAATSAPAHLQAKPSISRSSDEVWKEVSQGLEPEAAAQPARQPARQATQPQQQRQPLQKPPHLAGSSNGSPPVQQRRRDVRPPSPFASNDVPFVAGGIKRLVAPQAATRQEPAPASKQTVTARYIRCSVTRSQAGDWALVCSTTPSAGHISCDRSCAGPLATSC